MALCRFLPEKGSILVSHEWTSTLDTDLSCLHAMLLPKPQSRSVQMECLTHRQGVPHTLLWSKGGRSGCDGVNTANCLPWIHPSISLTEFKCWGRKRYSNKIIKISASFVNKSGSVTVSTNWIINKYCWGGYPLKKKKKSSLRREFLSVPLTGFASYRHAIVSPQWAAASFQLRGSCRPVKAWMLRLTEGNSL